MSTSQHQCWLQYFIFQPAVYSHSCSGRIYPSVSHTIEHQQYTQDFLVPVGVGADPPADGEPPSEDVMPPAYPKYEGLAYKSAGQLPDEAADLQFPPASAARPAVVAPPPAVA